MKEVGKAVSAVVKKHGGRDWSFSKTDQQAEELWEGRKTALWSAMAMIPETKCWCVTSLSGAWSSRPMTDHEHSAGRRTSASRSPSSRISLSGRRRIFSRAD